MVSTEACSTGNLDGARCTLPCGDRRGTTAGLLLVASSDGARTLSPGGSPSIFAWVGIDVRRGVVSFRRPGASLSQIKAEVEEDSKISRLCAQMKDVRLKTQMTCQGELALEKVSGVESKIYAGVVENLNMLGEEEKGESAMEDREDMELEIDRGQEEDAREGDGTRRVVQDDEDEESDEESVDCKAVKNDDAEVHVERWNLEVCKAHVGRERSVDLTPELVVGLDKLRLLCLRWHRRRVAQGFHSWLHQKSKYRQCGIGMIHVVEVSTVVSKAQGSRHPCAHKWSKFGAAVCQDWWRQRFKAHRKDLAAGRDVIERQANAAWWDWSDGSRCLHWKWPAWYQEIIRHGLPVWFVEAPKQWVRPQSPPKNLEEKERVKKKLNKVRTRRYVVGGPVTSLTSFFAVPKGEDDIRMVHDGTKSGLNQCVWVPRFPLPTVESLLRAVGPSAHMADFDIGECFLNFALHESLQALAGLDLTHFFGEGKVLWEKWVRAAMGLRSSPCQSFQAVLVAREVIMGDRKDPGNVHRWDEVRLNLPGSKDCDPRLPWVSKMRISDGKIAADLFVHVDDGRVTGNAKEEVKEATQVATSVLQALGIQDAPRKRRWGSRRPGAWAGSIVEASKTGVCVTVSQEKWDKSKRYIGDIAAELRETKDGTLDFKSLEKKRGFLICVTRTYPSMVPCLKGMHLTLDGWREDRDSEGWRKKKRRRKESRRGRTSQESGKLDGGIADTAMPETPPARVRAVPRLRRDMEALAELFGGEKPPKRRVRSKQLVEVFCGFGDASAVGNCANFQRVFNDTQQFRLDDAICYRHGHWCDLVSEESSNYRELLNLVESLELQVRAGRLRGAEVFLFTDNSAAEGVFCKGNSTSCKLFELVLRLRRLEMEAELALHVIHVSGTRMIMSGADGGLRGDLNQGVMAGRPTLEHVPLHLSGLEWAKGLEEWIVFWIGEEMTTLAPEDWFDHTNAKGVCLWAPPPAAADVVAQLIGESIHKRPWKAHLMVVPRLMTGRWRREALKNADMWLEIPAGTSFWPKEMHEPLTLLFVFPLIRAKPWRLRGTPVLDGLGRALRPVWESDEERGREAKDEDGFTAGAAGDSERFLAARNGDFLITPFQCDLCHFRNINQRDPCVTDSRDKQLLGLIRVANIDAFWSAEPSAVNTNLLHARRMEEIGRDCGMVSVAPNLGPFPVDDVFGMKLAVCLLKRSLDPGRNEKHVQFSTARKTRAAFSNVYHASKELSAVVVMAHKLNKTYHTECPGCSCWFDKFVLGCHKRVGDLVCQDHALSKVVFSHLLVDLEEDWEEARAEGDRHGVAEFALVLLSTFLVGLRGEEAMKTDVSGFLKHIDVGAHNLLHPHVILPLIGRLKGETGEQHHMMVMARVTKSGFMAGRWADRLARLLVGRSRRHGFVFIDEKGKQAKIGRCDDQFHERLQRVQVRHPELFEPGLNLGEACSLRRSGRRGSTSEAINSGAPQSTIDLNNRWRRFESARGRRPGLSVVAHHADVKLMLPSFWQCSWSF